MKAWLLAVLLAVPFRTPTPTPGPATYVLIQKDGAAVRLEKAPERKGNAYVGKLWPTGQLVSVPVSAVDERKTAAANPGGGAKTPSAEKSIGTRYSADGPQTPLGNQMKLKGGRKKVERTLQRSSGAAAKPTAAAPAGVVDRNGRGESWWRGRAAPLKEELADAEAVVKLAGDDRKRAERSGAPSADLERLRGREDEAARRSTSARGKLDALAEEARKAGAPESWVR
ncbi:MAG: hypothetical protein ACHQPI_06845 [Thermoanaerobaculia bacterium]